MLSLGKGLRKLATPFWDMHLVYALFGAISESAAFSLL
jgi:hypothetical protein